MHEFAQSKGKIVFFEKHEDGLHLGSLAGVFLGVVAGLLAIRGYVIDSPTGASITQLGYEAFLAGLGLKGIAEAAGGTVVPSPPSPSNLPQPPGSPTGPWGTAGEHLTITELTLNLSPEFAHHIFRGALHLPHAYRTLLSQN